MPNQFFTPFPILKTNRLTLRQLGMDDDQQVFVLRSDREINKYLERKICNTIGDARHFIEMVNENVVKNESLYWGVTLTSENVLVGTICLFDFSVTSYNCEIGYELLTDYQGQGIMKEALEAVIDYAFHSINMEVIEACFHRKNLPSLRLLEKCSFQLLHQPSNKQPDLICYYLKRAY